MCSHSVKKDTYREESVNVLRDDTSTTIAAHTHTHLHTRTHRAGCIKLSDLIVLKINEENISFTQKKQYIPEAEIPSENSLKSNKPWCG